AFTEDFYHRGLGRAPAAVLDALVYLRVHTEVWFEITTRLIPGHNDSDAEIDAECAWIAHHLGSDAPLYFTAFPDYQMRDVPASPPSTTVRTGTAPRAAGLDEARIWT